MEVLAVLLYAVDAGGGALKEAGGAPYTGAGSEERLIQQTPGSPRLKKRIIEFRKI